MKTTIVYATKHGCTDKCAHTLANELEKCEVKLINVETTNNIEISSDECVIIGSSVHAGMINKKVKAFIDKNTNILLNKKLGLFLCCMYDGEKALKQFQDSFPEDIRNKATAHGLFGGEFDFDKMNFLEKAIVKKVANVEKNVSNINYSNIKAFAEKMKL